ncbi:MAG: VWA domain-containing protein [Chloroflexi bacterium]|nr:VWA domain-containing protein [Chloroflexota bacterium]
MLIQYRAWDGTQHVLDLDAESLLEAMSDDLLEEGDLWRALQRLFRQGAQNREGQRLPGLQDLLQQLRQRRQQQLQNANLNDTLANIREKLREIQQTERQGIDKRVDEGRQKVAEGGADVPEQLQKTMERMAQSHKDQLDQLPADVPGQIQGLQNYDFMDPNAREMFNQLMEQLRQQVMQQQFQGLQQAMQGMTPGDLQGLREMLRDLNQMLDEKARGGEPDFSQFMDKWGSLFPGVNSLDELIEQLQQRQAQMQSMLDSMSAEQRRELMQMMQSLVQDPGLRNELAMLAANLEELRPMDEMRRRYPFRGDESLNLEQAMQVMQDLQEMDRLERQMRDAIDSADATAIDREALERQLGEQAREQLEQLDEVTRLLEEAGLVERNGDSLELTPRAIRKIGQKALRDIFQHLARDRFGNHEAEHRGRGGDRTDETKQYEFGDPFMLDLRGTLQNSLYRGGPGTPLQLVPNDFQVYKTEQINQASTVLLLDLSRSMIYRGCFLAAKKVALALHSLIKSQFPRDNLYLVTFSLYARQIQPEALTALRWSEWEYGTNLQDGLLHARKLLARHKGGTRQVIVITDGEPTAYWEPGHAQPVFSYPPTPRTIQQTLLEVGRCTREGLRINTFMLERSYGLMRFVDDITRINRGRAFFADPERLGDYILVDYLAQKTRRVA